MGGSIRTNAAAAMLGVSPNTLRSWERRFGFPEPRRTAGGHRQFDLAEMYLRPVVAADPQDFFARRLLATVHLARNRPGEALPLLDNLSATNGASRETLLAMMGQANLQVGDVSKAIAFFREGSAEAIWSCLRP